MAAGKAMDVDLTALSRWVKKLPDERHGRTPTTSKALTAEHQEIQALKEEVRRLTREKDIFKKRPHRP